jgi:uncharacterized protein (DUF1800 family)
VADGGPDPDLAHLLRRAAFGASDQEVAAAGGSPPAAVVDQLLGADPAAVEAIAPPQPHGRALDLTKLSDLQLWWVDRMVRTPNPLQELMTLFWHNHFATGVAKVGSAALMKQQNDLFRRNALGNFRTMLQEVTRDPAMLIWLDGRANHRRAPNENYARELMELFTLGVGQYTEDDVHAAARAFTGFHVDKDGNVRFMASDHDGSVKTFLGRSGPFGPDDVIAIILEQPAHPYFLAGKLWGFFIGGQPTPAQLAPHAQAYVASGFEIKALVRSLLTSPDFYAPGGRRGLVRSPAELVVAALRAVAPGEPVTSPAIPAAISRMGMELFNPPNVGGWPGGLSSPAWINAGTLMTRFNFAEQLAATLPRQALVDGSQATDGLPDPAALVERWTARLGLSDLSAASRSALLAYLADAGGFTPRAAEAKLRGLIQLLLASPEFQLK